MVGGGWWVVGGGWWVVGGGWWVVGGGWWVVGGGGSWKGQMGGVAMKLAFAVVCLLEGRENARCKVEIVSLISCTLPKPAQT